MQLFAGLRNFFAGLFSRRGEAGKGGRPLAAITNPDALRPVGTVMSLGPKATVVEASGHGARYLLKKWVDLPPNARRELLRLISIRQQFNRPGYLAIYASGEKLLDRQSGYVYCIQEHLPRNLKSYLSEIHGQLPLATAASIVREVASRLREAHAQGVIHGNLSPEAVFVSTPQGDDPGQTALDFVRYTGMDLAQNPAFTIAEVFPTGRSYLAPEALLGNPPDDLSDLYTLGILAYEIFTKKLPFGEEGASTTQKVRGMLSAQVQSISRNRQDIPNRWEIGIMKLLAKDRKLRYRSAEDFLQSVEGEL